MSYELKKLIKELENFTTLNEKKITALFKEELKEANGDEKQAAYNVRMRVKYMIM